MDCGIPAGEGDQQPVGVELGGGAGQRHGGAAGDAGGEEGEVRRAADKNSSSDPLVNHPIISNHYKRIT